MSKQMNLLSEEQGTPLFSQPAERKCSNFWCNCERTGNSKFCSPQCKDDAAKYRKTWGKDPSTGEVIPKSWTYQQS